MMRDEVCSLQARLEKIIGLLRQESKQENP